MKKILLVDDDALVARIYSDKLREEGYDVQVANDGISAIKKATEFMPDLVVLDLLMPKMTGADVLKYIREHPALKTTRVIVFSNSFLASLVEQIGAIGVEQTLPKSSTTPTFFIETVKQVLAGPEHVDKRRTAANPTAVPPPTQAPARTVHEPVVSSAVSEPAASETRSVSKDQLFRERVQREFVSHSARIIIGIRHACRVFLAAEGPVEAKVMEELTRQIGFLSQMAAMAGSQQPAQLASALEALLFFLHEKGGHVSDSCLHTIASAVTLLAEHLETAAPSEADSLPPPTILIVDDDAVSNRMLVQTLVGAHVPTTSTTDPFEALATLRSTPYDLVLLDVELPGMDGIALCEQLRALPAHKRTSVVFITNHADLKTLSRCILSGGDEFIAKPILPLELNVKVFAQLLKRRSSH